MSYDLDSIEKTCQRVGLRCRRSEPGELHAEIMPDAWLVFANTEDGTDTYLGFEGCPWHSHDELMLMNGPSSCIEYAPEEVVEAIATGEILVVSQYCQGELRDRWLVHREEAFDVRYIESGEEIRIWRFLLPSRSSPETDG